jgi:nucleotide-binding universal stress UspA family protein
MNSYSLRNILVPIDLSETSLNALETAVVIAGKHKSRLIIINVTEPVFNVLDDTNTLYTSTQANTDVLTALTGVIQSGSDKTPLLIQREGHVIESIISTAVAEHCDMIIMGTHGASGFRDGFLGSNAYGVIKYSTCPVLTIPPTKKFTSFRKVVFPVRPVSGALNRYHVASTLLAGSPVLQVLGVSNSKVERETGVLDKLVEEVEDRLEQDKVKVTTSWGEGTSIADDVLQYTQKNNPDLVVLTSILDAINKPNFIGPHTQKLINCAKVPVLTIKKIGVAAFA